MNQIFSMSRFSRLLRTYLSDNRSSLLLNVLLLVGIMTVLALFFYNSYPDDVDRNRYLLHFLIGWVAWYVFIIHQMDEMNEKVQSISYLLRPASVLEKYLLIVLISGFGFLVVYITVFAIVDAIGVTYVNHRNWIPEQLIIIHRTSGRLHIEPYYQSNILQYIPTAVWVFSAFLHPVVLTITLLIRRLSLPLVAVVILTLAIICTVANEYFMNALVGGSEIFTGLPFSNIAVTRNHIVRQVQVPEPLGNQIRYAVGLVSIILLYTTAYFRLKEREV